MPVHHDEFTGVDRRHPQCENHETLSTEITGLRTDLKWFLRVGTGIFSVCGIVTTLMSPMVVRMYSSISEMQQETMLMQKKLDDLAQNDKRIINQRNYDHKQESPLQ